MGVNLIVQAALMAVGTAMNMMRRTEGPRLTDLKVTTGDYGTPMPKSWAMRVVNPPIIWAEDLKEVKQTRKTKGGKYNDYTYYGTWAVALNDGLIEKVRRIWLDEHLAYDVSRAGPVTPFNPFLEAATKKSRQRSGDITDFLTIYPGSATQTPDPRMEATIEAKYGVGSCPAFRNVAYMVAKDLPLEKFGNRIPQIKVEIVTAASLTIPTESHDITGLEPNAAFDVVFSPDFQRLAWISGTKLVVWDVASRTQMAAFDIGYGISSTATFGVFNNGSVILVNGVDDIEKVDIHGLHTTLISHSFLHQYSAFVLEDGHGVEHWGTTPYSFYTNFAWDFTEYDYGWQAHGFFTDSHGNCWVVGGDGTTACYFRMLTLVSNPAGYAYPSFTVTMPAAAGSLIGVFASGDTFVVAWNGHTYLINPVTGTSGAAVAAYSFTGSGYWTAYTNRVPGSSTIWMGNAEYDATTGAVVRTEGTVPTGLHSSVYDPTNHALILSESPNLVWYFLDRVTNDGVTLGSILGDVADLCGVSSYDFSGLDQIIHGWTATQGQAANIVEPLLDAYDSDIRPHEFEMQGLKRTGVTTGTLTTPYFVKADPRYSVPIQQAAQLPLAVTINFADIDADQQANNSRSARPLDATGARAEQTIDMSTLAISVNDARGLADRYFRRLWNERRQVANGITSQQLALEPGDCQILDLDGETDTYRLVRSVIKANGAITCDWQYDHPSLAIIDAVATGAASDGHVASVIAVPGISKGFVLDIPLIRDADNSLNPELYVAASAYSAASWPGAVIFEKVGTDYTDDFASIDPSSEATWGYTTAALADVASPWVWDDGNSINVVVKHGTPIGCTKAEIDADPTKNLWLIGSELVNATTATLQGDGSYTLSGFKRGRRGTEWATGLHTSGEDALLLDGVQRNEMGLSDIGTAFSFKPATNGRSVAGAFPIDFTYTGATLKPYAPTAIKGVKDSGTGDWALSWIRRTRVGGAWTSSTLIPVGEFSESYELDIMNGTTVVRTFTELALPAVTWTAAMQTADFGSGQSSVTVHIYQMSGSIGRGFVGSATL